jgi:NitT/TauT family transport system substrate-binding protein
MQPGDVNVVHLESNEQLGAFEKGKVDGAVTFDPFRSQFLKAGAATVFDSTKIPGEIVDLIAVRADVLAKQPKAIESLLSGWFAAFDYMKADPKDAARRMGIRQQTDGEQFLAAQQLLHVPSRAENLKMLGGPSPELVTTGRRLMALMLESKLLKSELKIESVLAPQPLEAMTK